MSLHGLNLQVPHPVLPIVRGRVAPASSCRECCGPCLSKRHRLLQVGGRDAGCGSDIVEGLFVLILSIQLLILRELILIGSKFRGSTNKRHPMSDLGSLTSALNKKRQNIGFVSARGELNREVHRPLRRSG